MWKRIGRAVERQRRREFERELQGLGPCELERLAAWGRLWWANRRRWWYVDWWEIAWVIE